MNTDKEIPQEIKKDDKVMYLPPYTTFHSKRYEGVVKRVSKDGRRVVCKLGFGEKECRREDVVIINSKP